MLILYGDRLTLKEADAIAWQSEHIELSQKARKRIVASRKTVESMLEERRTMYGINTGFGKFSDVVIEEADLDDLQRNLIHSHACGVGAPFSEEVSRTMLLLRANALARGQSGIRPELIEQILYLLNARIHPVVPEQGSLGASGDLAPLAHLALPLLGEGEVFYNGERMKARTALKQAGITPIKLKAKEGLALINGTQAMTAQGVILYGEVCKLLKQSELIGGMTMEGLNGIIDAYDADLHEARGHQAQNNVASRMRKILQDSALTSHQGEIRVQDAYSLRCIPQVLGACWQTVHHAKDVLETEINAVTDNPLIFTDPDKVVSGGNFHGEPVAFAMDFLKLGIAETANISERRIERLVNPQLNDLPPFLSPNPGLESGAMIMQYTAASLVSENKTLAHPASVDSIPSSANQEDHVSMGTIAARHARDMLANTRRVVAIELICAMQAVEYRGINRMATATRRLYDNVRPWLPSITEDRIFSEDIEKVTDWLKNANDSDVANYTSETVQIK
ncbi:Histidine ammonia-lyase [Lentibacillus sp. JNUCC-1]|uniref:histidine ammonia-lyase n=1 Tax=Lentibacillus sp. JNUCC-1 TaxID=2654513 RepID=UPI0012E851B5|nr:histidine ammonia-lyase [Lentibacillus sp. JNUCC-1]MUV37472.1 Histidine ammonia-lyase [Lentibacillus sp. JNUCC-1]